ncbi:MAG: CoA ester lyase [Pseudomonadota bacterium]
MPNPIRPRRSVLYMPGSNARALDKARNLPADCLILDLEDAVAPGAKEMARDQVTAAVRQGGYGPREVAIRINGLQTEWGEADLDAAIAAGPDAILVPKIDTAEDVFVIGRRLNRHNAQPDMQIWVMMETPTAVLNARKIAAAHDEDLGRRLSAFVMGTNDLAKDTRARLVPGRTPLVPWLQICLAAARAYGLDIIDGVYNRLDDAQGFEAECAQGRDLGMDGKTLIHPRQIEPANAAFGPSADEIADAERIIAAFDLPENTGKGAIAVEGRMVERLHADMAQRVVALGRSIADREALDVS